MKEGEMTLDSAFKEVKHPYITIAPGVRGGSPVITGTRTKVMDIVIRYEFGGMTPDQIIEQFPHLSLAQIHDALSYYYEHKSELDEAYKKDQLLVNELRKHYPSRLGVKLKV